jgi:hypothetical protein
LIERRARLARVEMNMSKRRFLYHAASKRSFGLPLMLPLSVAFVILFVILPSSGAANTCVPAGAQQFDPEGEFNVEGEPPGGLSEVSTIELLRDARRSFLNPHAGVYTTAGVTYRFKTVNVTREKFTFETVAIAGISYSFTGRFLRGGVYAEMNSDQWGKPILAGRLTKQRGGRKVARANLKFSYFGGT